MMIKHTLMTGLILTALAGNLSGCSTPEEKAQKYYDKGMSLLETDPAKAKLEFQNALQMKKNMTEAIYGLALAAEKQADWKTCFVLLNKVLDENPKHVDANVKIGQMYLAAGELDKAIEQSKKALQLAPDNLNAQVLDASLDLKSGNYSSAVSKANQVLQKNAKNPDAYMILASERFIAKDTAASLTFLDKGIAVDPKNLGMYAFKVQVLQSTGNLQEAENTLKQVIQVFPDNVSLHNQLAQVYFKNDKKAEAENELREIAKIEPTSLEAKLNIVKFIATTKGKEAGQVELEKMVKDHPENFELAFQLVNLYEQKKDSASANELLKKITDNAGNKPEGLKAKSKIASRYLQNSNKEQALAILAEILKTDPAFQDALMLKAAIALDENRYDDAILDLRTILRDQPSASQALYLLGQTYDRTGSTALAEESYVKAVETSKFSPTYGIAYAEFLIKKNELSRAEKTLEDVYKKNGNNLAVIKTLAQVKIAKGDTDGAKALADQVKDLPNTNLSYLIEGAALAKNNDYEGSIAAFKKAHEAAPKDPQAIMAVVRTMLSKKNTKDALAFLEPIISNDPQNFDVVLLKGQVYALDGQQEKSIQTIESAIAIAPNNPMGYQQLAAANYRIGNIEAAKASLEKGISALPNSFDLQMALAELHMSKQDMPAAIKIYESLLEAHPSSLVAINNYASVIADFDTDKAKLDKAYTLAQKLKTSNVPQFQDTLGWISYRVGKYDEAQAQILQAIRKMPDYAVFHYHLGKVYIAKQDKLKAKESLEKALELSKNQNFSYTSEIKALLKSV